jgi:circadian clock protein KaiC
MGNPVCVDAQTLAKCTGILALFGKKPTRLQVGTCHRTRARIPERTDGARWRQVAPGGARIGPSGSGKSILASAFLAEGERAGETGVIAAFEQRPNRLRSRITTELISSGKVGLIDNRTTGLSVDETAMQLINEIRRLGASRVVIDSLSGFELALAPGFREDFRESLARMVAALANTGVTTLMTSELEDRYSDLRFSPYGTAFLTDAIIVQRYIELDSRLQRVMAVVKVRASNHSDELRLFRIDEGGIRIGDRLSDHEGLLGGRPTRIEPLQRGDGSG